LKFRLHLFTFRAYNDTLFFWESLEALPPLQPALQLSQGLLGPRRRGKGMLLCQW